jgi:hypothetical protein
MHMDYIKKNGKTIEYVTVWSKALVETLHFLWKFITSFAPLTSVVKRLNITPTVGYFFTCKIWGFHGGDYGDYHLLGATRCHFPEDDNHLTCLQFIWIVFPHLHLHPPKRYLSFRFPKKKLIHFLFLPFAACPTKTYCTIMEETTYYFYLLYKIKLNLCPYLIKHDAIKLYWEVEVYLHAFLTST